VEGGELAGHGAHGAHVTALRVPLEAAHATLGPKAHERPRAEADGAVEALKVPGFLHVRDAAGE
jgi:hypothetical protein